MITANDQLQDDILTFLQNFIRNYRNLILSVLFYLVIVY